MLRSIRRFLIVLAVGILLGTGLYMTMRDAIQPIADRIDQIAVEEYQKPTSPEPIRLPDLKDMLRGTLSIAKNVVVFTIVTLGVLGVQSTLPMARQTFKRRKRQDSDA